MRTLMRAVAVILAIGMAIILFFPGKEIYWTAEKYLKNERIFLNESSLSDRFGGVEAKEIEIFYDGIKLGNVHKATCVMRLFFVRCTVEKMTTEGTFRSMFPERIDSVRFDYAVWNPRFADIELQGDFGKAKGTIDMQKRTLRLHTAELKKGSPLSRYMKKDKTGWYYEVAF
jgi:hypothetical protein